MRDIKFRALFSGRVKSWIYGMPYFEEGRGIYYMCMNRVKTTVNPNTLCQYTGLKDVNGKEIYEGDIVQYYKNRGVDTEKALMLVEYKGCMFTIPFEPQVYGNIYENPELLEGVQ